MRQKSDTSYSSFILEALSGFGPVSARKMFGGYGIYLKGLIFGIIVNDTFYLKVDESTKANFIGNGSKPFSYKNKHGKTTTMSYWEVPLSIIEDERELSVWAAKAYSISLKCKKTKK